MKIFTSYLAHETNSFSPIPTNLQSFEELGIYRPGMGAPEDFMPLLKGAGLFFTEAQRRGDDIAVGLSAHAQPGRPLNRRDYETLRDWVLEDLRSAGDVDVVLMFMHGSMMAEGYEDCEGDLLRQIRELVGPDVPVGILLDLHCNISSEMLRQANFVKACKEYPHTDYEDRARELYDLCVKLNKGEIRPTVGFARAPMLGLYPTTKSPMLEFVNSLKAKEQQAGILSITLAHGFPWSDISDACASAIVITDGDEELAARTAEEICGEFYTLREAGQSSLASVEGAVEDAMSACNGTVVIADISDNPGGGAASDSTFVLRELLQQGASSAVVAFMWDPAAVELAFAAGEGSHLPMRIGGKVGICSGPPLDLDVKVTALREDAYQPHIADGVPTALGRTAVVSCNGIDIILNTIRQQPFSVTGLSSAGVDPWSKRIVVVKSTHHFYASFHEKAEKIIYCDAPGTLNSDAAQRPYRHIRRPIWPLDHDTMPGVLPDPAFGR